MLWGRASGFPNSVQPTAPSASPRLWSKPEGQVCRSSPVARDPAPGWMHGTEAAPLPNSRGQRADVLVATER